MANHPSAEKRHRQSLKHRARNAARRSRMRHAIKAARAAIDSKAPDKADTVKQAVAEIYRAASKKVVRARTASRSVERLMRSAGK